MARWLVVAVVVGGCGPTVADGEGSQSGGQGSAASEGSGGGPTATAGTVSASGADASSDPTSPGDTSAGDDTGGIDACLAADVFACPDGCARGDVLEVIDDACGTNSVEVCLPGGPKPGVPLTTYWAIGPDGPRFAEYGSQCGVGAQPEGWRECSGAPDEPADCACFCQSWYCRGDEDRRALDACALEYGCGSLFVDGRLGAVDHTAERCMLESLRDRVPGVYELIVGGGFSTTTTRFYLLGDALWRLQQHVDDIITCPVVSDWNEAERCTLADSEYFAACLDAPAEDCVLALDSWVSGCELAPPTCG